MGLGYQSNIMSTISDPDIIEAEITILKMKEEELMLELEEVRASISLYQSEVSKMEET